MDNVLKEKLSFSIEFCGHHSFFFPYNLGSAKQGLMGIVVMLLHSTGQTQSLAAHREAHQTAGEVSISTV